MHQKPFALMIKVGGFHLSSSLTFHYLKNIVLYFMLALIPVSSEILPFQCYSLYHKPFLSPANVLPSDADSWSLPTEQFSLDT